MVDRTKREARARMAQTGETYTEARRAVLREAGLEAPRPAPTAGDLRAAVEVLLRAWAPPPAPHAGDEYDDEPDGCRCGGGECNCAGGCSCRSCVHQTHVETRRCRLRTPRPGQPYAWCGQPTRYRVVAFCVHRGGVRRIASEGDPAAERGDVTLGDSIQRHPATYACSTQHARALIEEDQQRRATAPDDSPLSPANTFYEVESHEYEPDDTDVPGPLHPLLDYLESAAYWAKSTIAAEHDPDRGLLGYSADGLLRYTAWAAARAVEYATAPRDPSD